MKNNENNQEKLSLLNQKYLKELETNNNLFNQKIKNLNNSLLGSDKKNKSNIYSKYNSNSSHKKYDFNNSQRYENNNIKHKYNLNERDLNSIDVIHDIKNFTFKKKRSEKEMRDNNMIEINKELKKKIKELRNENEHKDYVINDLKEKIRQNNQDKKINLNYFDYNRLILDNEDKDNIIKKLENVIKNLKEKNENLNIDNSKLKNDNINLKNKINDMTSETDYKINYLNAIKKINEIELENNKLNKELYNLSNEYNIIKAEKEKLNLLIEEQNNIIFNYQKQLNTSIINNNQICTDFNDDNTEIENDYKYKSKYYNNLKRKENNYNDLNTSNDMNNIYIKYNSDKYDYSTLDENNNDKNNYNLLDKKKKIELNSLKNYLNSLLKERCKLENQITESMESPRTFSDIKLKSNITDKIALNDKEIIDTKNKLKKLRGY